MQEQARGAKKKPAAVPPLPFSFFSHTPFPFSHAVRGQAAGPQRRAAPGLGCWARAARVWGGASEAAAAAAATTTAGAWSRCGARPPPRPCGPPPPPPPPPSTAPRAWLGTWRKPGGSNSSSSSAATPSAAHPGRSRPPPSRGRGGGGGGGGGAGTAAAAAAAAGAPALDPDANIRLVNPDGSHAIVTGARAAAAAVAAKLDLVPVAPAATPPVYRLGSADAAALAARVREAAARTRAAAARRAAGHKEVRITALAAPHDVATRLRRARELVEKGHTVKLAVPVGRGGVPRGAALARLEELRRAVVGGAGGAGEAASAGDAPWCEVRDPPAHAARGAGPASVSKYLWPLGSAAAGGEGGGGGGAGGAKKEKSVGRRF